MNNGFLYSIKVCILKVKKKLETLEFTIRTKYLILLLAINQIQVPRTNVLMCLWVEILCKQKITENSCVKHPPSHLVGLLTKPREPSSLQACPSTADFGSSHSSSTLPTFFACSAYTRTPTWSLTSASHRLPAHPLKSNRAEWVRRLLKSFWNSRFQTLPIRLTTS